MYNKIQRIRNLREMERSYYADGRRNRLGFGEEYIFIRL